jgi:hypothetical protein
MPELQQPPATGLALTATVLPRLEAAAAARLAGVAGGIGAYELAIKPRRVIDQGDNPCCVSCALAAAMETLNSDYPVLAPMFHYFVTRYQHPGGADDKGFLFLDSGISTIQSVGICSQALYLTPDHFPSPSDQPLPAAFEDAAKRKLSSLGFPRIQHISGLSRSVDIKERLRANCPVIVGFTLPIGYPENIDAQRRWMTLDQFSASSVGHCALLVGYDDLQGAVRVQDSRGKEFADRGCWWMGYRVLDSTFVQAAIYLVR